MVNPGIRTITPDEALLLFKKLESENARVGCKVTSWGWSLFLVGKVFGDEKLRRVVFVPDLTDGVITLRLDMEDLTFAYAEPGSLLRAELKLSPELVPKDSLDSMFIAVILPVRSTTSGASVERENLLFFELRGELAGDEK